ncbi:hypothetical protein ATZ36_12655 [Candidatus Endomicrobiellum trichonymphae]|uniref:Uncharacterized protein n=1 Tax=Endomicrobium trichonymphae TaxID=1408204 RepID=A0A1E5IMW1_ENDTX|nr:hypothetical protein ATZ36_12655 [Candidatus Endomicrobium trichonymphae]
MQEEKALNYYCVRMPFHLQLFFNNGKSFPYLDKKTQSNLLMFFSIQQKNLFYVMLRGLCPRNIQSFSLSQKPAAFTNELS